MKVLARILVIGGICMGPVAAPAAERLVPVRLGEVEFQVSSETWDVQEPVPGTGVLLRCVSPGCHGAGQTVMLSERSPARPCSAEGAGDEVPDGGETRFTMLPADAPGGLDFIMSETILGCRNYVPPRIGACAVHNGRSYHLSTVAPQSCRASIWEIPLPELIDILRSARKRHS